MIRRSKEQVEEARGTVAGTEVSEGGGKELGYSDRGTIGI